MIGKVPPIPGRQALVRPDLWWGCDRIGLTFCGTLSALVSLGGGIGFGEPLLFALGGLIFWCSRELLRKLAKRDPQFVWIWLRNLKYRPVYDAVARWDEPDLKPRSWR